MKSKTVIRLPLLLLAGFLLLMGSMGSSCAKLLGKKDSYKEIGGDTNLDANKVGSEQKGTLKLNGSSLGTQAVGKVIKNVGGIVDVNLKLTVPAQYRSLISPSVIDAGGNINLTASFKNSTEGIAYINKSGKQFVIGRYDGKVGDTWSYTTTGSGRRTIERKVISKSTTDDFPWGFMNIKVITAEQTLPYPGFKKAVYKFNHKFGFVYCEIHLEDGSVLSTTVI